MGILDNDYTSHIIWKLKPTIIVKGKFTKSREFVQNFKILKAYNKIALSATARIKIMHISQYLLVHMYNTILNISLTIKQQGN